MSFRTGPADVAGAGREANRIEVIQQGDGVLSADAQGVAEVGRLEAAGLGEQLQRCPLGRLANVAAVKWRADDLANLQ